MNAECRMMNDEYRGEGRGERGEGRRKRCAPGIHHSSFIIHHSLRRAFSLLEVLVSMGVLIIGLLGVAALIPIGKLAMIETNKSDRTGACGRAGLRDLKVRRMLDANNWAGMPTSNVFAIDPLGCTSAIGTANLGDTVSGTASVSPVSRINLLTASTAAQADDIFHWHDDLTYVLPKDKNPPEQGDRPTPVATNAFDGSFSWFLTVAPSPAEVQAGLSWDHRRQFTVSVVVCHKRAFDATANSPNVGETVVSNVTCDADEGFGGIGIHYDDSTSKVIPKENEWVLLDSGNTANGLIKQTTWYRVVSVGNDGTATRATLVGCDWQGGGSDGKAKLIVVKGASGVYTTTVQLDDDKIWTK
jgi:hypothetical protein